MMKNRKLRKWIGLLLAVILILGTVTGCRGSDKPGQSGSAQGSGGVQSADSTEMPESELDPWEDDTEAPYAELVEIQEDEDEAQPESADPNSPADSVESADANLPAGSGTDSGGQDEIDSGTDSGGQDETGSGTAADADAQIDEHGTYTSRDDVALYIHIYGKLPENFITKKAAEKLGWHGGSLEPYAPGKCIGGGRFGNYEGVLPDGNYKECDIDTLGRKSRGAKRIVYSDDGRIYYTDDHYESFTQLY